LSILNPKTSRVGLNLLVPSSLTFKIRVTNYSEMGFLARPLTVRNILVSSVHFACGNIAFPLIFSYIKSRCISPNTHAKGGKRSLRGKSAVVHTSSPEETIQLGQFIVGVLNPGSVVGLCGELGTGKTHLIKGLARGLGVDNRYYVTSPSFTIINEYPGRIPLNHFDLFRLEGPDQMEELGYEEYLYGQGVTVIEWAEKVLPLLPDERLMIEITYLSENRRRFRVTGLGHPYRDIVGKIAHWKAV